MIQLHYLGGSSEITPFGNETVRTRSSEEAAPDPSPGDSDAIPGTPVGNAAPLLRVHLGMVRTTSQTASASLQNWEDAGLVLLSSCYFLVLQYFLFWGGSLPP